MRWTGLAAVTAARLLVWIVGAWQALWLLLSVLQWDFTAGALVFVGIKVVVLALCVGLELVLRRVAKRLRPPEISGA